MKSAYVIIGLLLAINVSTAQNIDKYKQVAEKIYNKISSDTNAFDDISYMCDVFGPRLSGSENLEKALDWMASQMKKDGLENVRKEPVMVPHWVRGNEYCTMNKPYSHKMPMLGLGRSIGTPKAGITAPVLVVSGKEELLERKSEAKGKIVVFNVVFENYGQAVQYRVWGASWAAEQGAVACLVRSVSPFGYNLPHTGSMRYVDSLPKVPVAAITLEDAELLNRLQIRGITPEITLYMEAETLPDAQSYNVIGEITGSEKPDEIIVIGGHSDCWDTGTGAHDDASGCITTWKAVKLLIDLGLRPKRTVRAVMFVNEENGVKGGEEYYEAHKDEKHIMAFEFDSGLFPPQTFGFRGPDSLFNKLKAMEEAFRVIGDITVKKGGWGVDIGPLTRAGVPSIGFDTKDEGMYFLYHHGPIDTIDKLDPKNLNDCIAAIATLVYIYADIM